MGGLEAGAAAVLATLVGRGVKSVGGAAVAIGAIFAVQSGVVVGGVYCVAVASAVAEVLGA